MMKVKNLSIIILALLIVSVSVLAFFEMHGLIASGLPGKSDGIQGNTPSVTDHQKTRTIIDMNNRTVTVPKVINKVFTIPTGGSFCPSFAYVLAPDKLVAWSVGGANSINKTYFPKKYRDLPVISASNYEAIIAVHPDIVIIESNDPAAIEIAQEKLGSIPVVSIISWSKIRVRDYDKILQFLGDLLDVPEKADYERTYLRTVLDEIQTNVSGIPESERVRVYYAGNGADGLTPGHIGLPFTETISICGGIDIVAENTNISGGGSTSVSKESVLKWKPDVIITGNSQFYERVYSDDFWKQIPAVQNHRVYLSPSRPVNWFDFPHGVNSIAGLPWAAHALYPERFSEDWSRNREKVFFETFYHMNVSDEQLSSWLGE